MSTPDDARAWILAVAKHMGMSPSQLSLKSGMAASTVTRYINDKSGTVSITERSLDAISKFSGVPRYRMPGERTIGYQRGADASQFEPSDLPYPDDIKQTVAIWAGDNAQRLALSMDSWALDLEGIMPGDLLFIDQATRPKSGDIVCASIVDWQTGAAETVIRKYEPPYILTHSSKLGVSRPEQVDDERVSILGVAISVMRFRE